MKIINTITKEQATGKGKVFWPDSRGMEHCLTITLGSYILFLEGEEDLNEVFMAFAPSPKTRYLDL